MTTTASYYLYEPMVSASISPIYPYWYFPYQNFPTNNYVDGGMVSASYSTGSLYDGNLNKL